MNVFQNILELEEVSTIVDRKNVVVGYARDEQEYLALDDKTKGPVFTRKVRATNINGEWHLLGNIITL